LSFPLVAIKECSQNALKWINIIDIDECW